eukprot:Skav213156  [mRNA]  locus=scaffold31:78994:79902:+ [translate_table: standard]
MLATLGKDELQATLQAIYNFARAKKERSGASRDGASSSSQPVFESCITLHEFGDAPLRSCFVEVEASNEKLRVCVTYNKTVTGKQLYDAFCERFGLEKSQFSLKWGGYEEASILQEYDTLFSYLPEGQVLNFVVKQLGGAKKSIVEKKLKKSDYYKAIIENFKRNYVPKSIPDTAFVDEAKKSINEFMTNSNVKAVDAIQHQIDKMSPESLGKALRETASSSGGTTEYKVKKLSHLMFSGMEKVIEAKNTLDALIDGGELALLGAFYKSADEEGITLAKIREMLKTKFNRMEGASASMDAEM